MTKLKLKENLH